MVISVKLVKLVEGIKENKFIIILFSLLVIALYYFLGFAGARTALGIILFWIFPVYVIISNISETSKFNLPFEESLFFSFFSGIIIIPSIVYWLSFAFSFKTATYFVSALLVIIGFALRFVRFKMHKNPN